MLRWQPEFQLNQPKNLMQHSPLQLHLMMLFMKFDQKWLAEYRDILLWKCGRMIDNGRQTTLPYQYPVILFGILGSYLFMHIWDNIS